MQRLLNSVLASLVLLGPGFARAGLFDDDEARRAILELRQSLYELRQTQIEIREQFEAGSKQIERSQSEMAQRNSDELAATRKASLGLQDQLDVIKGELARLRGQNEVLARDLAEMQRRQKDDLLGFDERMRKLEPIKVSLDGREFLAEPAEKRDYEFAFGLFRKGDFDRAQVAFVDFLNRYGAGSGYRTSSLFWLGNAQYALKDYKESIASFRTLIAATPDHIRVPESMLAISNCQGEMKDSKAARKTLEELVKAFPSSEAGLAAKDRLARLK